MSSSSDEECEKLKPWSRRNTDADTVVVQEVLGHNLSLRQDPTSLHLGLTVWDASIVCAKYLEKQSTKGKKAARSKGSNDRKYALELGSGPGLAGMAAALLGWHTTLTDVEELDWTKPEQLQNFSRHYDLIIATDCVYHEHLIHDLLRVMLHCADKRTTVLVCNEFRSQSVQDEFKAVFSGHFNIRPVGCKQMHDSYNDENIQLSVLSRRRQPAEDAVIPSHVGHHQGQPGTVSN